MHLKDRLQKQKRILRCGNEIFITCFLLMEKKITQNIIMKLTY